MSWSPRLRTAAFVALLGSLALPPTDVEAQSGPLFRFVFGTAHMGGDLSQALEQAIDAEFSIMAPLGPFRVGGGANWASFDVPGERESWDENRFHLLVGFPYRVSRLLRPYVEARYTFQRLRPEGDRYFGGEDEVLGDFVAQGSGFEGVLGTEVVLGPRVAIDVSGAWASFGVSPDLSEEGFGPIDTGTTWRFHLGVAWFPINDR